MFVFIQNLDIIKVVLKGVLPEPFAYGHLYFYYQCYLNTILEAWAVEENRNNYLKS